MRAGLVITEQQRCLLFQQLAALRIAGQDALQGACVAASYFLLNMQDLEGGGRACQLPPRECTQERGLPGAVAAHQAVAAAIRERQAGVRNQLLSPVADTDAVQVDVTAAAGAGFPDDDRRGHGASSLLAADLQQGGNAVLLLLAAPLQLGLVSRGCDGERVMQLGDHPLGHLPAQRAALHKSQSPDLDREERDLHSPGRRVSDSQTCELLAAPP